MKKKTGLKRQAQRAETLSKIAWDRVRQKEQARRTARVEADSAICVISLLAARLGDEVKITRQEIEEARNNEYVAQPLDDGGFVLVRADRIEDRTL